MTLFGRTTRPDGEREEGGEGGDERSQESENKRKEQLEKTTRKIQRATHHTSDL